MTLEKETRTFRHQLCLWLDDLDDPSRGNMVICDKQWVAAMEKAVVLASKAAEGKLSATQAITLHSQFIKLLPKKNDPEFLSESACQYYLTHKPPLKGSWSARDISDFILARAHRLYNQAYALERWLSSQFKSNPVGLPRTRSKFKNSRNYTPHGIRLYRAYGKRAIIGIARARISQFERYKHKLQYSNPEAPEIKLIETTDKLWINIRPPEIEKVWDHINILHAKVMTLTGCEKTEASRDTIIDIVAQIHWWFSQAMPYRRGSAAIGDMLSKQILQSLGIQTSCWKKGVAPDLEAYCLTLEEFVLKYPTMFDEKPRFNDKQQSHVFPDNLNGLLDAEEIAEITQGKWQELPDHSLRFSESRFADFSLSSPGALMYTTNKEQWGSGRPDTEGSLEKFYWHGGVAAVVRKNTIPKTAPIPCLLVDDTCRALLQTAHESRKRFTGKMVCVTGSDGKTTLKFLLHHLLTGQIPTQATSDAGNKLYPIACSLASIRCNDQISIVEAAITNADEGFQFGKLIQPDLCVYSDIGPAHLDTHGSVEAMLDHKVTITSSMRPGGMCVVNSDGLFSQMLLNRLREKKLPIYLFGRHPNDDARLMSADWENEAWLIEAIIFGKHITYQCNQFGEHIPLTTLGALLLVALLGGDVIKAAKRVQSLIPHKYSGIIRKLRYKNCKLYFYDDSQRCSYLSLISTLKMFQRVTSITYSGILVIGGVSGLGNRYMEFMTEVVDVLARKTPQRLYLTGKNNQRFHSLLTMKNIKAEYIPDSDILARKVIESFDSEELLVVKGQLSDGLGIFSKLLGAN